MKGAVFCGVRGLSAASLRKEKAQCDRERRLLWDGGLRGAGGRLRERAGAVPVRLDTGSRNLEGTRFSQRLTIPSTCFRSLQLAGGDHRAAVRPEAAGVM